MLKYLLSIVMLFAACFVLYGCEPQSKKKSNTALFSTESMTDGTKLNIKYRLGHLDYFEGHMILDGNLISGKRELLLVDEERQELMDYLQKLHSLDEGLKCDLYLEMNITILKGGQKKQTIKLIDRACSWDKKRASFSDIIGFMDTEFPEPHWRAPGSTSSAFEIKEAEKGKE